MQMKQYLYDYDIFPKVFLVSRPAVITVRALGAHAEFKPDMKYTVWVRESALSEDRRYPGTGGCREYTAVPDGNGDIVIETDFPREGMYHVQLVREGESKRFLELRVYALEADMAGRYPFRGDLHMHTCRSDGRESPAAVAANYRRWGYDFTVISDHRRYYPSLEGRQAFGIGTDDESPVTDMLVVQGEEIHLPLNDAHYVNFGGKWSINALVEPNANTDDAGSDPSVRSLCGECPEPMSREAYEAMIRERAEKVPLELEWEYESVHAAGGLAIFPHPYWLTSTMQLSESFLRFVYENMPFDAFEVLGGENYYQHNGFQTAFYYEEKARGFDPPVVGSADSHGSTPFNRNSLICSTLCFSEKNRTAELIDAIKNKYSVALDTISPEYRLVGDFRFVKYGSFLIEEYFPLHDLRCESEGIFMKNYALGTPEETSRAEAVLRTMKGQTQALLKKYFDI
ncbi:MAG: hypothetical protein MJ137_09365 [Clostridia bacterium]|nr:hypothetical protein [Clostridia bacterium]